MSEIDCVGGNDQVSACLNSEKKYQFDAIVEDDDASNAYMPDGLNLRGIYDANCNQINGATKGDVSRMEIRNRSELTARAAGIY